jgi:type II secretory pathway pseudopilin PulG
MNDMTSPEPMALQQLIARMQSDAQLWGNLLHVSGSALEISKCNYYAMHWKFKPSGIPTLATNIHTTLRFKNGDRTPTVTLINDAITVAHKHSAPGNRQREIRKTSGGIRIEKQQIQLYDHG